MTDKSQIIQLLFSPDELALIDRAANAKGRTRMAFIREVARDAAEEVVFDQTVIAVNPDIHAEFLARLDSPPRPNERLRTTMRVPAPWDEQ